MKVGTYYGLAIVGAGAVSWWRGKKGKDLLVDTLVYGAVVGTGLSVASYLGGTQELDEGLGALVASFTNGISPVSTITGKNEGMGNVPRKAVEFLTQINPAILTPYKDKAVWIDEVPEDPNLIVLHK